MVSIIQGHFSFVGQYPEEGYADALSRRPGPGLGGDVKPGGIALVDDLSLVDHHEAQRHLLRGLPLKGPVRGGGQRIGIPLRWQSSFRYKVTIRPGDVGWVPGRRRDIENREALDVLEGLVRGHDDATDALSECGSHYRRSPSYSDGDCLPVPIHHVVAPPGCSHRLRQESQLLVEDLVQRPVGGE